MLSIAVVDRGKECFEINDMLKEIGEVIDTRIKVEHFYEGEQLCQMYNSVRNYDLIMINVELPKMNGIEVASFIRNDKDNLLQQIVFMSPDSSHSIELHAFHPLDFLVKPVRKEQLDSLLKKLLKIQGEWEQCFSYSVGHDYETVRIREIRYLTICNRMVYMSMKNGEAKYYYGTLARTYKDHLERHGFMFIHKQYIVNPMYIKKYEYDKVLLDNGSSLPIGSSKRKDVRAMLAERPSKNSFIKQLMS